MIEGLQVKDIEQIYEEMIDAYTKGDYLEGVTQWGDDALMSPMTFGKKFSEYCERLGYDAYEYNDYMNELIDWCNDHLRHLENKFR